MRFFDNLGLDEGSIRCFAARVEAGLPAEMITVRFTVEGSPIMRVFRFLEDGNVEQYLDATRDTFAGRAWHFVQCDSYDTATDEPVGCGDWVRLAPIGDPAIEGVWVLEAFTVEGVETAVEIGVNTFETPWLEIRGSLYGDTGCNSIVHVGGFGDPPPYFVLVDGRLVSTDLAQSDLACPVAGAERALMNMLGHVTTEPGIEVDFTGDGMVWTSGDERLVFVQAEEPPD